MPGVALLDELMANAWPAAVVEVRGGWRYRWTDGSQDDALGVLRRVTAEDGSTSTGCRCRRVRGGILCVGHVRQFWGCKSPVQPDGGEARVKRKGGTARDRLKAAWNEIAT